MKKRNFITLAIIIMVLFSGVQAQTEVIEIGGGAKLVPKSFKEENKAWLFEISAEYPELQGVNSADAAKFNELVKTTVMQDVADFRQAMLGMNDEELKFTREHGITNYTEIGYSVGVANPDVISLFFGNGNYTGGAHPNFYSNTINFDLKNGRELKLEDLFRPGSNYLEVISAYAIKDLNGQSESGPGWAEQGAGPEAENFKSWNLTPEGLRINFDAYQVGPYVIGPQESTIPYSELKEVLRVLDFAPVRYANNGNPVNWCRNGLFPQEDVEFKLARVVKKTFFYKDDDADCPASENCKTRAYVIRDDEVIVARTYGNYACSWYQPKKGSETVGWISLDDLQMLDEKNSALPWIGEWTSGENTIKISPMKISGKVSVRGNAFWRGLGDNIHIGEIDFSGIPEDNRLFLGDGDGKYDCRVKMQRLNRFLIVSDNLNCGGMNVTFNGIYQR